MTQVRFLVMENLQVLHQWYKKALFFECHTSLCPHKIQTMHPTVLLYTLVSSYIISGIFKGLKIFALFLLQQCISDVLFSVNRVNFLPTVDFENKIDHISPAYAHLYLVLHSAVHSVLNTQHFKFAMFLL